MHFKLKDFLIILTLLQMCYSQSLSFNIFALHYHFSGSDHVLEDPHVRERELFIADAVDTYPVSALRYCNI